MSTKGHFQNSKGHRIHTVNRRFQSFCFTRRLEQYWAWNSAQRLSMLRFVLPALLVTLAPAAAEQFTIRCERNGGYNFATFDTGNSRLIWEVIGGSVFRGQIERTSDGEIQFVMLIPGRMQ